MMTNNLLHLHPRNEIEKTKNRPERKAKMAPRISLDEGRRYKSRVTSLFIRQTLFRFLHLPEAFRFRFRTFAPCEPNPNPAARCRKLGEVRKFIFVSENRRKLPRIMTLENARPRSGFSPKQVGTWALGEGISECGRKW
jgi:hypothetical protein